MSPEPPIPIWLDCDPGHDDAFAILLAAYHPALHLLGLSTVHGNASVAKTTANALSILTAIGRTDVPVYAGASRPFCRDTVAAEDIHGQSGLDGTSLLPVSKHQARPSPSFLTAIYQALISQPPATAWVIATGALTNVALLFAVYPDLASHIAGLSIMGGAIGDDFAPNPVQIGHVPTPFSGPGVNDNGVEGDSPDLLSDEPGQNHGPPLTTSTKASNKDSLRIGNITPYAEFNIYIDPESASAIFRNPVLAPKTTLITLDLTHQVLATRAVRDKLLHGNGHDSDAPKLRRMFHDLLTFFAGTYETVFGLSDGPPLHDPLAVAVVLEGRDERVRFFDRKRSDERGSAHADDDDDDDDGDGGNSGAGNGAAGERYEIDVYLSGSHRGVGRLGQTTARVTGRRPVDRWDRVGGEIDHGNGEGTRIPLGVDVDGFWAVLTDCLDRVGRRSGVD